MQAGHKNRFTNVACFDEILDRDNEDFYVHANTFRTPYGNFLISQAPNDSTNGDHLHLMWIYNVQTVVCLVSPEEAGGYFVPKEGETFTSFQKYQMKTIGIFDEKQGVTVYQCELKSYKAPKKLNRRMIYIICCDTSVGSIRSPRQQTVIMEYMWAFEEANAIENGVALADAKTTVLVHAIAGTRRCASFVATSVMCKQLLEAGNFSAMETWFEMRKRRAHTCTRKHDFFSSIYTFFAFCVQCSAVSETDENYVKSMEIQMSDLRQRVSFVREQIHENTRKKRELASCCIGPPGMKGFPGKNSRDGYDGEPGRDGQPGRPADGDSRMVCIRECPTGRPGREGGDGPKGSKGQRGRTGQQGDSAPPSIRGEPGERGDKGFPGVAGPAGEPGEPGHIYVSDGPPGKDGETGPRGPPGEKGRTGRDGEDGLPGERGERGYQGLKGEIGKRGPVGTFGPIGPKGEPWPCESCPPPRVSPGYYVNKRNKKH